MGRRLGVELLPEADEMGRLLGVELFPEGDEVKLVGSIELEISSSKTWVLVDRDIDEGYVLAWSPCDGERLRIPLELVQKPDCGLLLAPGTKGWIETQFEFEVQMGTAGDEAFVCFTHQNLLFSSVTGSWERLDSAADTVSRFKHTNGCPMSDSLDMQDSREWMGFHVYEGKTFAMVFNVNGYNSTFQVLQWEQGDWQTLDSHLSFCQGVECGGYDFFYVNSGGRYMCNWQSNEQLYLCGRMLVVYDLEDKVWHYHSIMGGGFECAGITKVMVCNRGHLGNIADSFVAAFLTSDESLLHLPPQQELLDSPQKCDTLISR